MENISANVPKLDAETLKRVAKNARLNLTEQEIQQFLPQLQGILDAFSSLQEIDIKDVKPSFQPIALENVMREDQIEKSLPNETVTKLSPHQKESYLKGPKVM